MKPSAAPYIGVTGVATASEADSVVRAFESSRFTMESARMGMVGFLATEHTARGGYPKSPRHVADLPALARLTARIAGRALPVVHYEAVHTPRFAKDLLQVFRGLYDRQLCRTVQLNTTPHPDEVRLLLEEMPELDIIFQVRPELLEKGGNAVADTLTHYRQGVRYVLIDPSCGQGKSFDLDRSVRVAEAVRQARPDLSIGFAGGFSPQNTEARVRELRAAVGNDDFSIDVEGRVRTADDRLNHVRVGAYAAAAARGFDHRPGELKNSVQIS